MFAFKAVDRDNKFHEGHLEAATAHAAAEHLFSVGQTVLDVSEIAAARPSRLRFFSFTPAGISERVLTEFLSQCRMLIRAGIPLEKALSVIARSKSRRDIANFTSRLQQDIKSGKSFAQSLAMLSGQIPHFVTNTIGAGEASGHLEDVLDRLVAHMERSQKVRSEIKDGLIYPTILTIMAVISVSILMLVLVPQFKPLFDGARDKIPAVTRFILAASDYFPALLAFVVVALAFSLLLLRILLLDDERRKTWDRWKLSIPLGIGDVFRDIQTGMFSRMLSLLLQNGIPAAQALALTRDATSNRAFAAEVDMAREHIRTGGRLSAGLQTSRLFASDALDLLAVGEEASNLPGVLTRIADLCEERVERSTKRLMELFVPALTVTLGCVIAGIVAAILTALLSINQLALR
ncbi:type II secretion system F family protein [Hyphomicrobium sp. ghe19]|uniref:type II secretion system F family protein n=1 Tax=Hyphomicrobium sp. ghe19 TaxID=2682968 RepID=UPI0030CB45FC